MARNISVYFFVALISVAFFHFDSTSAEARWGGRSNRFTSNWARPSCNSRSRCGIFFRRSSCRSRGTCRVVQSCSSRNGCRVVRRSSCGSRCMSSMSCPNGRCGSIEQGCPNGRCGPIFNQPSQNFSTPGQNFSDPSLNFSNPSHSLDNSHGLETFEAPASRPIAPQKTIQDLEVVACNIGGIKTMCRKAIYTDGSTKLRKIRREGGVLMSDGQELEPELVDKLLDLYEGVDFSGNEKAQNWVKAVMDHYRPQEKTGDLAENTAPVPNGTELTEKVEPEVQEERKETQTENKAEEIKKPSGIIPGKNDYTLYSADQLAQALANDKRQFKVTIVTAGDFNCQPCNDLKAHIDSIKRNYPNVSFYFLKTNRNLSGSAGQFAKSAAAATGTNFQGFPSTFIMKNDGTTSVHSGIDLYNRPEWLTPSPAGS